MQQEQAYLDALQAARTYQIATDGKLKITYGEGSVLTYGTQAASASQPARTPITPTISVTTTQPVTATGSTARDRGHPFRPWRHYDPGQRSGQTRRLRELHT